MDFKTAQKIAKAERRGPGAANQLVGSIGDLLGGAFRFAVAVVAAIAVTDIALTVTHHHHQAISVAAGFVTMFVVMFTLGLRATRAIDARAVQIAAASRRSDDSRH